MELEDLKNTWNSTQLSIQQPHSADPEILNKLGHQQYRSKIKSISIPEILGSIVCLAAAVLIASSFGRLDTLLLQGAGAVAIFLLLLLPIISALSTRQLSRATNVNKPYVVTLKAFATQKIRFVQLQKLNITLSYLLLVSIIVLLSKLVSGNDLSANKYFWIFSFTIGFIFLLFYSKWVEKYYRKTLQQAEELLKELAA